MPSPTDRIEKKILLSAPRCRIWRALSDSKEFGSWFRASLAGSFVPGQTVRGHSTYPGHEGVKLELTVVEMQPERYFSYRWQPNAVDPNKDYSSTPTSLVEFTLEESPEGTLLTVVESGFDAIPDADERLQAIRNNERGWSEQTKNIAEYVSAS